MSSKFYMLASVLLLFVPAPMMAQQQEPQTPTQNAEVESDQAATEQVPEESRVAEAGADFNQEFAFNHLKAICDIGPRMSTTQGMAKQQAMLQKHFEALGAQVGYQNFSVNDPRTPGKQAQLSNLVVRFHKDRTRRILLCCHYDTRPFPDRDPVNPQGVFIGANDGASGAAFLCEMGRHMPNLEGPLGFDFIFFDGEEFVYTRKHPMFLGSTHFAREYDKKNWDVKYDYAVLVDMIGDKQLQLKMEVNSLNMARDLTKMIWSVAKDLRVREFRATQGHTIRDDHLPLNQIAGIPTCDIIDFDYPNPRMKNRYWHTTMDSVENCSAASLGKVGKVMLEWSRRMQDLYDKSNKKKSSRTANRNRR
jgi:hypothetical protein